ncbi:hypothetical protein AMTRI_Chr13g116700 [Amborella trichopoda]
MPEPLLYRQSAVAPEASLSEHVVEERSSQYAGAMRVTQSTVGASHCDCRSMDSDCRSAILHCWIVVVPEGSLSERIAGACSSTAGVRYRYVEACEEDNTVGAHVFNAGALFFIAGALWLQRLHCRSVYFHCWSVLS